MQTEVVALVWYSGWEMECCGEPFSVGDSVEWSLADDPDAEWLEAAIGRSLADQITHQESHHGTEAGAVPRTGRVVSIRCAHCRYAPTPGGDERQLYPVAGTAQITHIRRADGTERAAGELRFNGYVVELDLEPM